MFGCDTNKETNVAPAASFDLDLKDIIVAPSQQDLGKIEQSLHCKNNSEPCGDPNKRLFAVPDPDFDPVIVLLGEEEDNKTAIVVLGEDQEVQEINDTGIIAQIINSFSVESPKEVEHDDDIPHYERDSRDFSPRTNESHVFQYSDSLKDVEYQPDKQNSEEERSFSNKGTKLEQSKDKIDEMTKSNLDEQTDPINVDSEEILSDGGKPENNIAKLRNATKNLAIHSVIKL